MRFQLFPARALSVLLIILSLLLSGCLCDYLTKIPSQTNKTTHFNQTNSGLSALTNRPPVVSLTLINTSGHSPFSLKYTYNCYDPDDNLASCELRIDGQVYAKGTNQSTLFPSDYKYPDFYFNATEKVGTHTLEIFAVDGKGLNASKKVTFTVLPSLAITEPGWYTCNGKSGSPCDVFQEYYCDKFTPEDLEVRKAAAQAISKHPGAFSLNQLLDIYDWVHSSIFYQNVPVTMWPPYYPNETLSTKSGDCKNQAVLIASMVEAIGGSARVLYIPECRHAFAEVYVGSDDDREALDNAVWAHYGQVTDSESTIHWHTSKNATGGTENWFIFDTAGGQFPGDTIEDCLAASQTFELRDCNAQGALKAPEIKGTAYGPNIRADDTQVIQPLWGYHYGIEQDKIPGTYKWCHYNVTVESRSRATLNWYVTTEREYNNFDRGRSFRYYYGEEQVQRGNYEFDWTTSDVFYVILVNGDEDRSITTRTQIIETCYTK